MSRPVLRLRVIRPVFCRRKKQRVKTHFQMTVLYFDLPAQIRALRPELDAAVARTLDTGAFCLGPEVAQFEKDFATYCGAAHAVGFNSGTSALHVAAILLNLGPGDEVIT